MIRGYGQIAIDEKSRRVHRVVYEIMVGPIPAGLTIDHLCLETRCCNPGHLEPVTHQENIRRKYELMTHCKHGHEFDKANTLVDDHGWRRCRACARDRYHARYVKQAKPTHCPQGHEFTPENTRYLDDATRGRRCKTCERENNRRAYWARKTPIGALDHPSTRRTQDA